MVLPAPVLGMAVEAATAVALVAALCVVETPCAGVVVAVVVVVTGVTVGVGVGVGVGVVVLVVVDDVLGEVVVAVVNVPVVEVSTATVVVALSLWVALRYTQRPPINTPIITAAVISKLPTANNQAKPVLSRFWFA